MRRTRTGRLRRQHLGSCQNPGSDLGPDPPDGRTGDRRAACGGDSLAGQTVTIEGVCTHTCKHGARKIFLMGSDDTQTIRVESGELGSFDPQCVNRVVRVTGRVDEERIDEAYLARWEAQVKAQTAEKHGTTEGGMRHREGRTPGDGQHRRGAHRRLPNPDRSPQGSRRKGVPLVLLRDGHLV